MSLIITYQSKEAISLIERVLKKVKTPKRLIRRVEKYIHAVTMQMFRGRRPDTSGRRGVKWPRLKRSTIDQKIRMKRKGTLYGTGAPRRPMVRSGKLRDSLKILNRTKQGFEYGTRIKSKKGFNYPGYHNANKFNWLFLNRRDVAQIAKMLHDFISGQLKTANRYVKK